MGFFTIRLLSQIQIAQRVELNKEYEQIMAEILEPLKECMTDLELEDLKERMYGISYQTERYGFMLGVCFMLGLLAERIQIKE